MIILQYNKIIRHKPNGKSAMGRGGHGPCWPTPSSAPDSIVYFLPLQSIDIFAKSISNVTSVLCGYLYALHQTDTYIEVHMHAFFFCTDNWQV